MSLDEKMVLSKFESEKDAGDDSSDGRLLRDLKEISRFLYLHKKPPKDLYPPSDHQSKSLDIAPVTKPKSNVTLEGLLYKEKRSSIWNWNPLKALTNIRNHRFNCCFFLHVHSIEGLSSKFDDLSICVNWRKKKEVLRTRPARVSQGVVEFEETLMHRCLVYGNKNGPENSAKYEPILFLLNASVIGAPKLDIGKHWVDLTRLLPLNFEELEEEQRTTGKWTTSFKLTGKATGAMMNVTFGFSLLWGKSTEPYCFVKVPDNLVGNELNLEDCGRSSTNYMDRRLEGVPKNSRRSRSMDIRSEGSDFAHSISFLYRTLEEEISSNSDEFDVFYGDMEPLNSKFESLPQLIGKSNAFDVHETEMSPKEDMKLEKDANPSSDLVETIDITEIFKDIETTCDELKVHDSHRNVIEDFKHEENGNCREESTAEDLESGSDHLSTSKSTSLGLSLNADKFVRQNIYTRRASSFKKGMVRSLSLDALTESVANDFLDMLGIEQCLQDETSDSGPESPRERLLRQFEEESLASGSSMYEFKTVEKEQNDFCDVDLSLAIQESKSLRSKRNEKLINNMETEALMDEWGLDKKDFHHSSCISSGGFGSPIHLHPEVP